jgi:hypothetical protein
MKRILGALLVAAALVVPASASATAQVGNVITRGVAVDAAGQPTAATVTAFALPDDGPKTLQQVAQTQAGSDGAFTLTAADPAALNGLAQAGGGSVDVLIQVAAAGGTATTMTQWVTAPPVDAAPLASAAAASPLTLAAVDPYPRKRTGAHAAQVKCLDGSVFGRPAKKVLSTRYPLAVIGELNNAYKDAKARFIYTHDASTETQIAFSADGSHFGVGAGGTASKTVAAGHSTEIDLPRIGPYSKQIRTKIEYQKVRVTSCGIQGSYRRYVVRPVSGHSAGVYEHAQKKKETLKRCSGRETYPGGGTGWQTTNSQAQTWAKGLRVFGFTASTRSGWSSAVTTGFRFNGPQGKRYALCGWSDHGEVFPADSAPRIFSGAS